MRFSQQFAGMRSCHSHFVQCVGMVLLFTALVACGGGSGGGGSPSGGGDGGGGDEPITTLSFTGGETNPICSTGSSTGDVRRPQFVRNVRGQTGWYA